MRTSTKFLYLFTAILLAFALWSCKTEEPDNPIDDTGEICVTDSMSFSFDKDAGLIIINSSKDWSVNCKDAWISFSASSGKGKTGILVGASENEGMPRTTTLTIKAGDKEHAIKVKQSGAPSIEISVNNIKFKMILVAGGTFLMGETTNNSPAHNVKLSDYYICETEVTNGLWNAATGSLPYDKLEKYAGHDQYKRPNEPVTAVTWNDITNTFLPALKTATGREFRLPTEAEWEFAALGGLKSKGFSFSGSNVLDDIGWDSENSGSTKKEVKLKEPNELGLYDMSGNAAEWCYDWYEIYYSVSDGMTNPKGPASGTFRVVRGGNYLASAGIFGYNECKVKQRRYAKPGGYQGSWGDTGNPDEPQIFVCDGTGFRFVLSVTP